ncbi:hypothetical protein ACS0TY_021759 [Phlomoides rotata]
MVNVLGVCDTNMKFVYVLTGWEGSSIDSSVLCDAVNHTHGFKVRRGQNVSDDIDNIEMSIEWNIWRDALAQNMFNEWSYTMDGTGSIGCHDTVGGKSSRGGRSWTKIEDFLVHRLKEIVKIG